MKTQRNESRAEILDRLKLKAIQKLNVGKNTQSEAAFKDCDKDQLINELQTYHVELEMQNSELKSAYLELTDANQTITKLYDLAPVGYLTVDQNGIVTKCNLTLCQMFGLERVELVGANFGDLLSIKTSDTFFQFIRQMKQNLQKASCDLEVANPQKKAGNVINGEKENDERSSSFWIHLDAAPFKIDPNGSEYQMVLSDITDRKAQERSEHHNKQAQARLLNNLSYQATHDSLTGLINRNEFQQRLGRLLQGKSDVCGEHVLCYLDLDQFKVVNDACGHAAGDELLRQISQMILGQVRKRDTFARLGGDEFGIIMEHCTLDDAKHFCEGLRNSIEAFQFCWDMQIFRISASIGLAELNASSGSLDTLLKNADTACYMAKEKGRNCVHIYHEGDQEITARLSEMKWANKIQNALLENLFVLCAQPIAAINNKPYEADQTHFEILLRMIGDLDSYIPPGAFLGAAERYSLAPKIDTWVIKHVFDFLRNFTEFQKQIRLCSINLSGTSLSDNSLFEFIKGEFEQPDIDPSKICFEITETAAISNMSVAQSFILGLKKLGCKFALDDFGSGLSSFAYLKKLPIDYVKVDGLFIRGIADDEIDYAIVSSIISICQALGKKTIAEYVENERVLECLEGIGVDFVQGLYVGMPRPLSEFVYGFTDLKRAEIQKLEGTPVDK